MHRATILGPPAPPPTQTQTAAAATPHAARVAHGGHLSMRNGAIWQLPTQPPTREVAV